MIMLSRVAERLYWMARYLERAEDTARLTQAYTHLVMDIPRGAEPGWDILVRILDAEDIYLEQHRVFNEPKVLGFLIADPEHGGSILSSISGARENVRTTRDVLPGELWEHLNELYLYALEFAESSVGRRNRHRFLDQVIARCQMIQGLIISTLCRDHASRFIHIGHLLERADMTTRVIDVGAAALLGEEREHPLIDPLIWAGMLQALSAMGTYRRAVGPVVEAHDVMEFVFREPTLPRSVRFCLNGIRSELAELKNNKDALRVLDRSRRRINRFKVSSASREEMHAFIDRFQTGLQEIGDVIRETWFLPESA